MHLQLECTQLMGQLKELLEQIKEEEYVRELQLLKGNSIGKHVRHILELFEELSNGCHTGVICYDQRQRSILVERSTVASMEKISDLLIKLALLQDSPIGFKGNLSKESTDTFIFQSSVFREFAYNIEHAIHHMAIIEIAVRNDLQHIQLPDNFGVAPATIRYKNQCAQ